MVSASELNFPPFILRHTYFKKGMKPKARQVSSGKERILRKRKEI
jgi:hypothetical protein